LKKFIDLSATNVTFKEIIPRFPHDYMRAVAYVEWTYEDNPELFFESTSIRLMILHYYSLMPKAPDGLARELKEVRQSLLEKFEGLAPELWGSAFVRKAIPALRDIASIQTSNDEKIRINKVLLGFVQHARKDSEGKNTSDDDKQVSGTVTLKNALKQKNNVTVPGIGTELVFVKPAKFQMGDPATLKLEMGDHYSLASPISKGWDGMAHEVTLTRGFWLGKFEVTRKEWGKIMNVAYSAKEADLPVASVRWSKAREFCRKLTEKERASGNLPDDLEFRLPTEAEWELACRGGTGSSYSFGDDAEKLGDYAWFNGQLDDGTKKYDANAQVNQLLPKFILEQRARNKKGASGSEEAKPAASALDGPRKVGGKKPNPYGLHDMHGNVQEMVLDWVNVHPRKSVIDPVGSISMGGGARGGGWKDDAKRCKSSTRHGFGTFGMSDDRGFRLALGHVIPPK
jgi:formylglycine-generating enzyme required for sulfatase activity